MRIDGKEDEFGGSCCRDYGFATCSGVDSQSILTQQTRGGETTEKRGDRSSNGVVSTGSDLFIC